MAEEELIDSAKLTGQDYSRTTASPIGKRNEASLTDVVGQLNGNNRQHSYNTDQRRLELSQYEHSIAHCPSSDGIASEAKGLELGALKCELCLNLQ